MPLYEYQCSNCAHKFERIVKFSDPPLTTCPQCGQETVKQCISAPAVQFKGDGWYVTDYAKKNPAGANSSSSSKSETPAASEKSSESPAPPPAATDSSTSSASSTPSTPASPGQ